MDDVELVCTLSVVVVGVVDVYPAVALLVAAGLIVRRHRGTSQNDQSDYKTRGRKKKKCGFND